MKKALKWTGIILLVVIGGGLALLLGSMAYESVAGPQATDFTNVTYEAADGATLHGYLAEPAGEGPFPAVVLIHEWWGLNEDITKIADELASEGYVVLAPDAYRGQTTDQVQRALYFVSTIPGEQIESDLDQAWAYVRGLPNVDGERTAAMGFCFGGRQAFGLGARNGEITAVVDYYGGGVEVNSPADLGQIDGPFLGIFGAEDASIPLSEVEALENALIEAGLTHQIIVYPGVGHAFLDSENLSDTSQAAGQAWQVTLDFLNTHLQNES
ncbi:MAG: dienelactone hydrolase family protein [Anaerolineales bacterium]|nr:dienelactone hydrolase family protein [Anaerolineales bacterium]